MNLLLKNAIDLNHDGVRYLFDSYGINEPATCQNVKRAIEAKGTPFVKDLQELVIDPYVASVSSYDDVYYSDFGGKIMGKLKSRRAAKKEDKSTRPTRADKKAARALTKQESEAAKVIRKQERAEAKAYNKANGTGRGKQIAGAVMSGALDIGEDVFSMVSNGGFNVMDTLGSIFGGAGKSLETWQDSQNPQVTLSEASTKKALGDPGEAKKDNTILYAGIAAGVVLLIAAVLYFTGKKKKK